MTAVGFEPTQHALVELESTTLDHSGKLSLTCKSIVKHIVKTLWAPCKSLVEALSKHCRILWNLSKANIVKASQANIAQTM